MTPHSQLTAHSSQPRTLSIGGVTFDLFTKPDASIIKDGSFTLPLGSKINLQDVIAACGGGADNTSVGLARLGCLAGISGVIGNDQWGELICKNLEAEHVDTSNLTVIENEHSSFALILLSPGGERTILVHKSMDRHFDDVTFDREKASQVDAVYLNHIHEDSSSIEDDLVAILASSNVHLSWNPGGHHIKDGMNEKNTKTMLAHTDLLLLNKEEALAFAGVADISTALTTLRAAGVKIVCVTDGPNGSTAFDGTHVYSCPSLPCPVVDTTGAGDAFGTAMTWALISGKDLPTALKAGTINAMSVVGVIGAQPGLLTAAQMETSLTQTPLSVSYV